MAIATVKEMMDASPQKDRLLDDFFRFENQREPASLAYLVKGHSDAL